MKKLLYISILWLSIGCSTSYQLVMVDKQANLREEYCTEIENLDTHEYISPWQMASDISKRIMVDRRLSKESRAYLIDYLISTLKNY